MVKYSQAILSVFNHDLYPGLFTGQMKKVIGVILLCFLSSSGDDSILQVAAGLFPGYTIENREYSYKNIDRLIDELLEEQPAYQALRKRISQAALRINELEQTYVPRFKMGVNTQKYDFRERYVTVYKKVPVEWDNENPEQIDIDLPNGGKGLIWIPKPTKYEMRYIDLHASRPYEGNSAGFTTGLNYEYHSGISLDLMNLRLNKRFSPETYGFDWYSSLDNTITIPVLKIFQSNRSPRETEIKNIKRNIENLEISAEMLRAQEKNRLRMLLLNLYLSWEKHHFFKSMIELTKKQINEVNTLSTMNQMTISEKIATENELQGFLSTENIGYFEILSIVSALRNSGDSLIIYRLSDVSIEQEIAVLEKKTAEYLNLGNLKKTLSLAPQLRIQENNLKNAKAQLSSLRKSDKIQLDLTGSLSLFTSSDLGFKSPVEAVKMALTNPDGMNSMVGMQFSMPLSFKETDYQYRIAAKEYEIASDEFRAAQKDYEKRFHDSRINILNLKEGVRAAQANCQYAQSRLQISEEFFKLKRISAYEYNSYRKENLRREYALKEAQINYHNALADFLSVISLNSIDKKRTEEKAK